MSGGIGGQAGGLQPEHGDREGGRSGRRALGGGRPVAEGGGNLRTL